MTDDGSRLELLEALDAGKPPTGSELLEALVVFLRRFVVMSDAQADTVAIWVAHSHAFEVADTTPYLAVTSAEMRSGKTLLLELLELLVKSPLPTANISDSALFRAVSQLSPTLLFDEIDAIFGPKARDREDLRGMLNAGFRRGAVAYRMGGAKMTELQTFNVFSAKAFAGIGRLPSTIADRCIPVRLERKSRDEQVERFRRRDVSHDATRLREQIARWADAHLDELASRRPHLPDELDDRAQDVWEPLLAIADSAGGGWAERARTAAVEISSNRDEDDASLGVRLLADVRRAFDDRGEDHVKTSDLLDALCLDEEAPWGDWFGKPFTSRALSKLLKPFAIKTMPVWVDGTTVRGYKRSQFENAWSRYVPPLGVRSVRSVRSGSSTDAAPNVPNTPNAQSASEGLSDLARARAFDEMYPPA
jgi:hypothetical protein